MEGALGIEARVVSYTQQREIVISWVLHFPGNFTNPKPVNKIAEVFFQPNINNPGQLVRVNIQFQRQRCQRQLGILVKMVCSHRLL